MPNRDTIAWGALVLAAVLLLRLPAFWTPILDVDEAQFAGYADWLLHGGLPYVSSVDTKPLGIYWFFAAVFALGMARFIRPSVMMWPTWLMCGALAAVIATGRSPRRDVSLLLAGMALGYFLEYWGTSRACWTYYTREIPPLVTVMAHGYGQVLFARTLDATDWGFKKLGASWTVKARDASDPMTEQSSPPL